MATLNAAWEYDYLVVNTNTVDKNHESFQTEIFHSLRSASVVAHNSFASCSSLH